MRQPNGFGGVSKIGGDKKRRNPWRARVTDRWEWDETKGRAIQKFRTIGYFPTRKDAIIALSDYNRNPAAKGTADVTFSELFEMWKVKKFDGISQQGKRAYNGVYKHSAPLHDMKVKDIKAEHMESIMDNLTGGVALQKMLKTFWNQIFRFALERDIITKSYAEFVKIRDKDSRSSSKRQPFTKEQIQLLWDNVDKIDGIDTVLIMIYTGMRPSELLTIHTENIHLSERYMIGGIKTDAGKDRVIPLHKSIIPLIEKRISGNGNTHLVSMKNGNEMQYRYYLQYLWNPVKESLELERTPHECRHTFVTLATAAGVDSRILKMIVGHSTGDITERYTHAHVDTLVQAVDMIE